MDFNIGSSFYRLGNYVSAYQSFNAASEDPEFYVLSHINMALCAAKMGDRELLSKHLIIVSPLVTSERYKQQLLNIAEPFGLQNLVTRISPSVNSTVEIAFGRQYKINLQLIDQANSTLTPTSTPQADANFLWTTLNLDYQWRKYFILRLQMQDVSYQSEPAQIRNNNYRYLLLGPTFFYENQSSIWSASLSAIHTDLADQSFQNQALILLKALAKRGSWRGGVYLQQRSLYSTDANYHYLQGQELSWGVQVTRNTSHWSLLLDTSYTRNEREDYYDNNNQFVQSYSPSVSRIALNTRYRFDHRWSANLGMIYQAYRYPASQPEQRRDQRRTYDLGLQRNVNSHWSALLNFQTVKQSSTQATYAFDSRLFFLAARYRW